MILLEALEIRYLGNRDPNLFFALLTDFRDAPERTLPDDDALLAHARAAVEALNETYREDRPCIFYLFHRPRVWNPVERVWMGYERKRGKLEQFNALLRGGEQTAFSDIVGDTSILASIKYVITLDTDTQLPRDAARTLIGNIAHPLNRPVYDARQGTHCRRLCDSAATRFDQPDQCRPVTLYETVRGRIRHRSLHARGFGCLPGYFRRGVVYRQGHLRCGRVSSGRRWTLSGESHSQSRPAGKRLCAFGTGDRCRPH